MESYLKYVCLLPYRKEKCVICMSQAVNASDFLALQYIRDNFYVCKHQQINVSPSCRSQLHFQISHESHLFSTEILKHCLETVPWKGNVFITFHRMTAIDLRLLFSVAFFEFKPVMSGTKLSLHIQTAEKCQPASK